MSLRERIDETRYMLQKGTSHNQDSAIALENQLAIMEALERIEEQISAECEATAARGVMV